MTGMVYSCRIQRRDFGDLLSLDSMSRIDLQSSKDFPSPMQRLPRHHALVAVWSKLVQAWAALRRLTGQRPRSVESEAIARACAVVMDVLGVSGVQSLLRPRDLELRQAVVDLTRDGYRRTNLPQFLAIEEKMQG